MARARATEVTTDPMRRLNQLGAVEHRRYATSTRRVFYAERFRSWITLSGGDRGYTLRFYDSCPC